MKYSLRAISVNQSFHSDGYGYRRSRVVDSDGKQRLDRTMWEAGMIAYRYLESKEGDIGNAEEYAELVSAASSLLNDNFFPEFVAAVEKRRIVLNGGSKDAFIEAWKQYDWVEKLVIFFQIAESRPLSLPADSERSEMLKEMAALAILWRLDSAVLSEIFDGSGLIENVMDVIAFRDRLEPPQLTMRTIEAAKDSARKEVARAGANARHAEHRSMRKDVFQWLDANMSRFRSMDAAAEAIAGKVVPVSFRTARSWVSEWKKQRSASRL